MKAYSQNEEEGIRVQELVREWTRSGFLEPAQAEQLEAELRVDLKRTNVFFRGVLFVFTTLIVAASCAFVAVLFHLDNPFSITALCLAGAFLCVVTAGVLINSFRLYRFGVEEALACASVVLLTIAVAANADSREFPMIPILATAAFGGFAIYLWLGYVGVAVISMACVAAIPLGMTLAPEVQRLLAAAVLFVIFVIVRGLRKHYRDDFPGDQYGIFQGAAWGGLYLALNLQLGLIGYEHNLIYWCTYAATLSLPVIGGWMALGDRDRPLIQVNLAMALITFMTNKSYLGLERKPWDPILFGLFLMAAAILVKRWLSRGANAHRYGFTAKRMLSSDRRVLSAVGTMSAAFQANIPSSPSPAAKPEFGGGRSGGAGASGSF